MCGVHRSGPSGEGLKSALPGADSVYIDKDDSQTSNDGIVDLIIAVLNGGEAGW